MRSFYWLAAMLALLGATAYLPQARAVGQQDVPLYTVSDLGTLGGVNSQAYAINAQGEVAGWAETGAVAADGEPIRRGFHWKGSPMRGLGTLGGDHSAAFGLNDLGWVVGIADSALGQSAVLWNEDLVDLGCWWTDRYNNYPIGTTSAYAVNGRGLIAGQAGGRRQLQQSRCVRPREDTVPAPRVARRCRPGDQYARRRGRMGNQSGGAALQSNLAWRSNPVQTQEALLRRRLLG